MIFLGHGLGGHIACQLASYGIHPRACIFAGGVYSDLEVILSQKYLPLVQMLGESTRPEMTWSIDEYSVLIAKNLGLILQTARKNGKSIHIHNGTRSLLFAIHPELNNGDQMPRSLFRHITSPTFILHGSADIDVSLWNSVSIEQAVKQTVLHPKREIIKDRDHWFRPVPKNRDTQYWERFTGECFNRETDEYLLKTILSFIHSLA